jgi:hypothetical protein
VFSFYYQLENLPSGRQWFRAIDVNLTQDMIDFLETEYNESLAKLPDIYHQFIKNMPNENNTELNCSEIKAQCEENLNKLMILKIDDQKREKAEDEDQFLRNLHLLANTSNTLKKKAIEFSPMTKRRKMMLKKNVSIDFPVDSVSFLGSSNNNNNDCSFIDKNLFDIKRSNSLGSDEAVRELPTTDCSKSVREIIHKEWKKDPEVDVIKKIIGEEIKNIVCFSHLKPASLEENSTQQNEEMGSTVDEKSPTVKSIRHKLPLKLKPPHKKTENSQPISNASSAIDLAEENYVSPIGPKKRIAHGIKDESVDMKEARKRSLSSKGEIKIQKSPKRVKSSTSNMSINEEIAMDLEELPFKESGPVTNNDNDDDKTSLMTKHFEGTNLLSPTSVEAQREAISKKWSGQLIKRSKKKSSKKLRNQRSKKSASNKPIKISFSREDNTSEWKII